MLASPLDTDLLVGLDSSASLVALPSRLVHASGGGVDDGFVSKLVRTGGLGIGDRFPSRSGLPQGQLTPAAWASFVWRTPAV